MALGLLFLPDNLLKFLSPRRGEEAVIKCNLEVLVGWIALRLKCRMLGIKTINVEEVYLQTRCVEKCLHGGRKYSSNWSFPGLVFQPDIGSES